MNGTAELIVFSLGWTIIHSFWQYATLTLGLVFLLRNTRNAKYRHKLILITMCLCLAWSAATFANYFSNALTAANTSFGWVSKNDALNTLISITNQNLHLIVLVWLIGCVGNTLSTGASFWNTHKLIKHASTELPAEMSTRFNQLKRHFSIRKKVEFRSSNQVNSPCVYGLLKPIILIPTSIIFKLPQDQLEAIVLHELAHVQRNDFLVNTLQSIAKCLFFFNPFYLYLSKLLDQEREHCADELASQACGDPLALSKGLSAIAELHKQLAPAALAANSNKGQILLRVKRILNVQQKRQDSFLRPLFSIILAFAISPLAPSLHALPFHQGEERLQQTTADSINPVAISQEALVASETQDLQPIEQQAINFAISRDEQREKTQSFASHAAEDFAKKSTELKLDNQEKLDNAEEPLVFASMDLALSETLLSSNAQDSNDAEGILEKAKAHDFALVDNSRLKILFANQAVDFSQYDSIAMYPLNFDLAEVVHGNSQHATDAWINASPNQLRNIQKYFRDASKRVIKRSKHFDLAKEIKPGTLLVEFRLKRINADSTPKVLQGYTILALQAVVVDAKTDRLVALIEHEVEFLKILEGQVFDPTQLYDELSAGGAVTPRKAWQYVFNGMLVDFHQDMKMLAKLSQKKTNPLTLNQPVDTGVSFISNPTPVFYQSTSKPHRISSRLKESGQPHSTLLKVNVDNRGRVQTIDLLATSHSTHAKFVKKLLKNGHFESPDQSDYQSSEFLFISGLLFNEPRHKNRLKVGVLGYHVDTHFLLSKKEKRHLGNIFKSLTQDNTDELDTDLAFEKAMEQLLMFSYFSKDQQDKLGSPCQNFYRLAINGHQQSQEILGLMLQNGVHCETNLEKSKFWLEVAKAEKTLLP